MDLNNINIIIERYEPVDLNLNISLVMTDKLCEKKKIKINSSKKNLEEAGLKVVNRDPGTAYHCPEGSLFTIGDKEIDSLFQNIGNPTIDTAKLAPLILHYFGVKIPSYMKL